MKLPELLAAVRSLPTHELAQLIDLATDGLQSPARLGTARWGKQPPDNPMAFYDAPTLAGLP